MTNPSKINATPNFPSILDTADTIIQKNIQSICATNDSFSHNTSAPTPANLGANTRHPTLQNVYQKKTVEEQEKVRQQHEKLKGMMQKVNLPELENKMEKMSHMTLFRGVTNSPEMIDAFKKMMTGTPTNMPVMWGFRTYKPGQPLANKEIFTLKAIASDIQQLKQDGFNVTAPIILADLHAQHNNVPAEAIPKNQGGSGNEGYQAYYDKIASEAKKLGIPTVKLNDIFTSLNIDPKEVAARGAALTKRPEEHQDAEESPDILHLTSQDLATYVTQAQHMVERYPTVPANQDILNKIGRERKQALIDKALAYIHFRQGEGSMLLPRLSEFFESNVVPIHVSDPSAEDIGVKGLYIFSKSTKNKNVADIPWKGVKDGKEVQSGQSKFPAKQVEAIKLVQKEIIQEKGKRLYAYSPTATRIAVEMSRKGLEGQALLDEAQKELQEIEIKQKQESQVKLQSAIENRKSNLDNRIISQEVLAQGLVGKTGKPLRLEIKKLKAALDEWKIVGEQLKQHPKILKER